MTIREFVRNHLTLKNTISNLEIAMKVITFRSLEIDTEEDFNDYYACAHVRYGHIPVPLIWRPLFFLVRKKKSPFFDYQHCKRYSERIVKPHYIVAFDEKCNIIEFADSYNAESAMDNIRYYDDHVVLYDDLQQAVDDIVDFQLNFASE